MLGLIGGALQGGAQAANEMATNTLQERREKALLKIRQDFQTSEREAGQEFQSSERMAGQDFTLNRDEAQQGYAQDNARLQHEMSMAQERYRQQQQNNRTAMTSRANPQWQVLPDGEGGFVRYDPVSNTASPVPEGVDFGGSGEINPRQEMIINDLQSQREIISDQLSGEMLDPGVRQELQRKLDTVNAQIGRYLNPGSGNSDLDAELDAILDADPAQPTASNQGGGVTAPPRPGQGSQSSPEAGTSSADAYVSRRKQQEANEQADKSADDEVQSLVSDARRVLGRATIPNSTAEPFQRGGLIGRQMSSGINTEAETEKAREMLQRVKEAYNAENDPQRKAMLQKALDDFYEAGVTE